MQASPNNLRGIVFMLLATLCFIGNDSLLKIAMAQVPPFEALFIRGVMGVVLGAVVLAATGMLKDSPKMLRPSVMIRNVFEFAAAAGYIFAIAYAPLADITALAQMTPMLVMLGAVLFYGDKIGWIGGVLVAMAFVGTLLVAQPGSAGFQPFALLGLWSATCVAIRDLIGRRVQADVPALVVAVGASLVSLMGIGVLMVCFEQWVTPELWPLIAIAGSAALVTLGQLLLFTAYRVGEMGVVVPFFYSGSVWALVAGAVIFQTVPNLMAMVGIALIILSGVMVVVVDQQTRRLAATP